MNTTLQFLSALLSGAFLNLGMQRVAEIFDPLTSNSDSPWNSIHASAMPCVAPCDLPQEMVG